MSENESAMFPDFQQELAHKAQSDLALRLGQEILQGNTASAAAGIYSQRLQHVEEKLGRTLRELKTLEGLLAEARAATVPADLRKIDTEVLLLEMRHRGGYTIVKDYDGLPQDAQPIVEPAS